MEYLPWTLLWEAHVSAKFTDSAGVMSSLFSLTSSGVSYKPVARTTLIQSPSLLDRYPSRNIPTSSQDVHFYVGPMNDITFLDYLDQVLPELCAPFDSEFEFLEAFAFRGRPPTRPKNMLDSWTSEKVLEVYHAIRPLYRGLHARPDEAFRFAHWRSQQLEHPCPPDDWRGYWRPWWLRDGKISSSVASSCCPPDGWMTTRIDSSYKEATIRDPELRSYFRLQLAERNFELFCHYWLGPELWAFLKYVCSHTYGGNAAG